MARNARTEPENADRTQNLKWKIYLQNIKKVQKWLKLVVVNHEGRETNQ